MNHRPAGHRCLLLLVILLFVPPALPAQQTLSIRRTTTVDPCRLASADTLKMLLGMGLKPHFPLEFHQDGHHIKLSNPTIRSATCPGLRVEIKADARYQDTRGITQYSSTGTMRFRSPLVGVINYSAPRLKASGDAAAITAETLGSARACLTNIDIVELNLENIPNWIDNDYMRRKMNEKLKDKACFDITQLVRLYLTMGGTIPVTEGATIERKKP